MIGKNTSHFDACGIAQAYCDIDVWSVGRELLRVSNQTERKRQCVSEPVLQSSLLTLID